MFFIVNKTKQTVVLGDIKVTLGPRQAVDLDKLVGREKSEKSKSLKVAKHSGQIEVRIKDGKKPPKLTSKSQPTDSLEGFKKELIEEMKGVMSNQSQPIVTKGLNKEDLAAFAKEIIKAMPKSETVIIQGKGQEVRTDEEVEIKVEELGEMNKRAVDKMVENVKRVEIKHNEEIQKNDLDNNISELEGLLDL